MYAEIAEFSAQQLHIHAIAAIKCYVRPKNIKGQVEMVG